MLCNHDNTVIVDAENGTHWKKEVCFECNESGRFIRWIAKPKNENSRKGQSALMRKLGRIFCEICLRHKNDLVHPDTLEIHHIIEVKDGGNDDVSNIQTLCTACHKQVHWNRTYMNRRYSYDRTNATNTD